MINFYETGYKILLDELRWKIFKVGIWSAYKVDGKELNIYLRNFKEYIESLERRIEELEKKINIKVVVE